MTEEMLEFENQMLLDVLNGDSLLIAAKGLSIETVILNLIKVHCDPGNLVLVLGTTNEEEQYFISQLEKSGVTPLPKIITAEVTNNERESLYLGGGVLFISSRILVVDLLKGRVPIANVTGFIVVRAHRILESCQEAFALRLYRQGNNTGFVNAFSRSPHSFSVGIMKLERIMKALFVTNVYLWPRFHATVSSSLQKKEPIVIELHVDLSQTMSVIHTAVLGLIHFCIKEIKRVNPVLDTEDITVENALSKTFYKRLQLQLDPIWHQLSGKTKQLISDLRTLRSVMNCLTQSNSVGLHSLLTSLRTKEYASKNSGWMLLEEAETLFVTAKSRLFDNKQNLDPEPNPKWQALNEVLMEIQKENAIKQEEGCGTVLILVENKFVIKQLKEILTVGAKQFMHELYNHRFGYCGGSQNEGVQEEEDSEENDTITLTQNISPDGDGNTTFTEYKEETVPPEQPVIVIQQFKKDGDGLSLRKTLLDLQPSTVVMYDADISAVRQIEIHQCIGSTRQLKVYFLIYGGSVEEQAYLTTLRREKEAFQFLIKEKSTLVIEDIKAAGGLKRESANALEVINTRKGGVPQVLPNPKIIVDMREFRSELPSLLHKRGIDVEPVTLQIGDYILSPEICVERKSISDLIGSLNSGRLYTQALAMNRYYAKPMLLIEFDENKPFALQGRYYLSSDMSSADIRSKLLLLTLHFPRLRLVWSPSPFASAQLFHELKEGREEPSATVAASIGVEVTTLEDERLDKYNVGIQDFLIKLPGVNTKNIRSILDKGKSLDHLITLSQTELQEILGNPVNAELLYNALHKTTKPLIDGPANNFRGRGKGKNFGNKRRRFQDMN